MLSSEIQSPKIESTKSLDIADIAIMRPQAHRRCRRQGGPPGDPGHGPDGGAPRRPSRRLSNRGRRSR